MKDLKLAALMMALPLGGLAACAGTGASYEPKLAAAPAPGYAKDLEECRNLARSERVMNPETQTQAVIGGIIGGLAGAEDGNGEEIIAGMVLGAATGAAVGAADTRHTRKSILLECLKQRGQPVAG